MRRAPLIRPADQANMRLCRLATFFMTLVCCRGFRSARVVLMPSEFALASAWAVHLPFEPLGLGDIPRVDRYGGWSWELFVCLLSVSVAIAVVSCCVCYE